jgi:hypothetical protein
MRYGRTLPQQPPKRRRYSSLIIVAVLLGITAYFIGAGAAGGWLAENVINPVFNNGVGSAATATATASTTIAASASTNTAITESPQVSGTHSEEQITAQSVSLYTLQVGAFSDEANAKQTAQQVVTRGGAGFVTFDGSLYRVLVAGYTSENDAKSVKAELENQGISTTVFKLDSGALEFRIGAEQQQIDAVKSCFDVVPSTVSELQQIIYDADKGENVDDRIAALKTKADEVNANLKAVVSTESDSMASLVTYMDSLCNKLGSIHKSAEVSGVAFSSELKYNLISVVVDYSTFFKELSS